MTTYLYLDIETIPTDEPKLIDHIAASVKPPASMKKAETIEAWERDQKEQAIADAVAKAGLDGAYGRVCAIGMHASGGVPECFMLNRCDGEAQLLARTLAMVKASLPNGVPPVIVGHNITGFDLRFLAQRCMVHGVCLPSWWPRDPKPWDSAVHDTMHLWAGHRDYVSLDKLCVALGIEGKSGTNGADVAGMWERGEYEAIREYCMEDVLRTKACHERMMRAFGGLV